MDKAEAIREAVRLYLDEPPSLLTGTPADKALARAQELGATWDEIHAEELRQRGRH
ncbi:hypothetical protein ABT063_24730 [Streptomyces sp. NPDC002838]|uniref:hypothetical protein n=1 Tax=Streptomyces sp. NPDC002838 TaxID=3154436 RepID=UPI0033186E5A